MPTITERNGYTTEDLRKAISAFNADPSVENETRVLQVYEAVTGFSATCGYCIAERTKFITGLKKAAAGDVLEGAAAVAGALRGAVAINVKKLFGL